MKLRGGYNVDLAGRPARAVEVLGEPEVLHLPVAGLLLSFSECCVSEGQRVRPGEVLARDPSNYSVPLVAPREGTVRLTPAAGRITLEDVQKAAEEPYHPGDALAHVPRELGSAGMKRYKLRELGAWEFFRDARTGGVPDPFGIPAAVVVSTARFEPFVARGDVQIRKRLASFTRGLEHVQSLLEYQPIYLVVPGIESAFGLRVQEAVRGHAWVRLVRIPLRYGLDDFSVLARAFVPEAHSKGTIWGIGSAGVLAVDHALTLGRPATARIISLGGPGVASPSHLRAMPGYPLEGILNGRIADGPMRVIDGGVLTGRTVPESQRGLGVECEGLTVVPEHTEREFLGFLRPGFDRASYSRCFMSAVRGRFPGRLTTALRGERRPCISCGFCEEICPAGIMPHLIHRCLYEDELEEAERARADLCVGCGLCSFVCPSKIELWEEITTAQEKIREELHVEEAQE